MQIKILHLLEGAEKAKGLTVIIDVFRAFSTACYVYSNGAKRIIPVAKLEEAYRLKKHNPSFILMGERNNIRLPGFDYGNSPTLIQQVDFSEKTIIHTTSAGTQGIENAINADEIITGSFVNASAIINYIRKSAPSFVSLVCMGNSAETQADEDTFCANYIKNELEGRNNDFTYIIENLRNGAGRRLLDPANTEHSPALDFDLCLDISRFDFVLKAQKEEYLFLNKLNI